MTRRIWLAVACALPVLAQDLPKAEDLLDRYVEVTGGKAAYGKVKSVSMTGSFEVPAQGMKGPMTRLAEDGKMYLGIEIPGAGKIEAGVVDGIAWETNPMTGPRVKDGLERTDALRDAMLDAEAQWRKLYSKVETLGEETLEGEAVYKVQMTPTEGKPEIAYLSKQTGLKKKIVKPTVTQMGELDVEMMLSDYKEFGGLKTPTKMTQRVAGQEMVITVDQVTVNQPIAPEKFAMPADIQALVKKSAKPKQ